jgi:hypothetical protein
MDLARIVLADNPPEWREATLDPALLDLLQPDPDTGLLPVWSQIVYRALDNDRWYLLTNDERARSVATGRVERYLTKLGVEWPHRGALRLFDLYETTERDRGSIRGEAVHYERTISRMRRRGQHQPITIDHAYRNWCRARAALGRQVTDETAERLLGPMPRRHIRDGWPVGLQERLGVLHGGTAQRLHIPAWPFDTD